MLEEFAKPRQAEPEQLEVGLFLTDYFIYRKNLHKTAFTIPIYFLRFGVLLGNTFFAGSIPLIRTRKIWRIMMRCLTNWEFRLADFAELQRFFCLVAAIVG